MESSLPASLVPQEQERTFHQSTPDGEKFTPPALIQRQVDVTSFQSNNDEDNKVFSEEITYQYGTTTYPQLTVVSGKVSHVLEELYSYIEWLEIRNMELRTELVGVQKAVDMIAKRVCAANDPTSSI